MSDTIWIKPADGRSLPREGSHRRIIGPTPVTSTSYYRRAIAKGDALVCDPVVEARTGPAESGVTPEPDVLAPEPVES